MEAIAVPCQLLCVHSTPSPSPGSRKFPSLPSLSMASIVSEMKSYPGSTLPRILKTVAAIPESRTAITDPPPLPYSCHVAFVPVSHIANPNGLVTSGAVVFCKISPTSGVVARYRLYSDTFVAWEFTSMVHTCSELDTIKLSSSNITTVAFPNTLSTHAAMPLWETLQVSVLTSSLLL
jgi:hypothetical protein